MDKGEKLKIKENYSLAKINLYFKKKNDESEITLEYENLPICEYAIIFSHNSEDYYVADIFEVKSVNGGKYVCKFPNRKVVGYCFINIVDILKDETIATFELDPKEEEKKEEAKENHVIEMEVVKEETEENKNKESILKEDRTENKAGITEAILEKTYDFKKNTAKEIIENEPIKFEKNLEEKEEDLFDEEESKKNMLLNQSITKIFSQKLINSNSQLITQYLSEFKEFREEIDNHTFYSVDMEIPKLCEVNIVYNGFIMPFLYPYMGYKNTKIINDKYPDWIFGEVIKNKKTTYYVYGILGSKEKENQPFLGSTGYIYYQPLNSKDLGYWLMYLNAKTGKISIPLRPR